MNKLLENLNIDYLLVNSTNEYLVEYSLLEENARYKLTGFSGSTGDALVTRDKIYLFVDGRYHIQAENEIYSNVTLVKLKVGENQDDEIKKLIDSNKVLGIVAKKVSQSRLEKFSDFNVKLLMEDPINNYTYIHSRTYEQAMPEVLFSEDKPRYVTNLEEISYVTGLRNFSQDYTSKIWGKLFIDGDNKKLFTTNEDAEKFLKNFQGELYVDKNSINAYEYLLIKNPIHKISPINEIKSVKTDLELDIYKQAFEATDRTMFAIRDFIEQNDNISEFDIEQKLREEFYKFGAKNLSFKPIVAINKNSALAHYSQNSKDVKLKNGDIVLIDCGAYYEHGYATDITRVFVKGCPTDLQKTVYTTVLKAFLNSYNSQLKTGYEIDNLVHSILDDAIDGFSFNHGLGHGIGINVHEAPPSLSRGMIAQQTITNNMTFTIEPGLYNSEYFGIRLENSCYKQNDKIHSFAKMGFEKKLIDFTLFTEQEKIWLEDFNIL